MPGPLEFEFHFGRPEDRPQPRRATQGALRVLVMGDFSGRDVSRQPSELASRPIIPVDVDSFDDAMLRLAPRLELSSDDPAPWRTTLDFAELDDFHPDTLYRKLEVFTGLRRLRARLLDPATFDEAAAELKGEAQALPTATSPSIGADRDRTPEDDAAMFDRLLGARPETQARAGARGVRSDQIEQLIRGLVEPHLVRGSDPEQQRLLVATVDDATARQMRAVLHDPAFQALESAWRALHWLISNLETDDDLKIYLLDASRQELAADAEGAGSDLETSALYRSLVTHGPGTPGGEPWSLLIGNYSFATTPEDLLLLAALGTVAAEAGGAFLAAADPVVLGCRSLFETPDPADWTPPDRAAEERWQKLRRAPAAASIGLALPRVLLRLPYGGRSDPIEAFAFEEIAGSPDHQAYLWGNPAFACALLIGRAFQENGWALQPGDVLDLDDLPAHSTMEDGEAVLKPCAEVLLSQRAAETVLERGVMPLLSHRNRNRVQLVRFQSIARPAAPLIGPWGLTAGR